MQESPENAEWCGSLIWNAVRRETRGQNETGYGTNHIGDNEKVNWVSLAKCPIGVALDSRYANLSCEPVVA